MKRSLMLVLAIVAAASLAAAALAAAPAPAPKPDAHDRALITQLDEKVTTFRQLATERGDNAKVDNTLKKCPAIKKDPSQAFGALLAIVPALLAQLVNEYKPQLTDVRDTLAAMHPDSPLFRQWVGAESESFDLILQFDNHGQKVDFCQAATVLLDDKSTPAQVKAVLGIDPALIGKLFSNSSSSASKTLERVNPKMKAFFRSGGVAPANVTALTT